METNGKIRSVLLYDVLQILVGFYCTLRSLFSYLKGTFFVTKIIEYTVINVI